MTRILTNSPQAKAKKNIDTDLVGDKIGRIHIGRQDLTELQTRKMKGLKRGRDDSDEEGGSVDEEDDIPETNESDGTAIEDMSDLIDIVDETDASEQGEGEGDPPLLKKRQRVT